MAPLPASPYKGLAMDPNDSSAKTRLCPVAHADKSLPSAPQGPSNSQAKYEGIIDSAMDAIITVDDHQIVVQFNKAAEKMFRRTKDQALGQPLDLLIPDRFRQAHRHHIENFDQSQVTDRAMGRQKALTALRSDGLEFPIEASISQAEVDGRKHFTAIIRDISERIQAQRLLSEMEARYRTIFEHAGVGILMIDRLGIIIDANPACEKLLSTPASQLRQKPYSSLIHPRDIPALQLHSLLSHPQNQPASEINVRFIAQENRKVWARVVHTVVRDSSLAPLYFVAIIEDITQKKRTQLRLKRLRETHQVVIKRLTSLTEREREVLWLMVDGNPTKIMAAQLGISHKTIDVHRGRVMTKMHAESVAQLVQMTMPIRKHSHQILEPT
jgi:PAS domain S-box-containing protein